MRVEVTVEEREVLEAVLGRAIDAYRSSDDRDLPHVHRAEAIAVRDRGGHVGIGIVSSWDYQPVGVETTDGDGIQDGQDGQDERHGGRVR
jgi:hypothetical protein